MKLRSRFIFSVLAIGARSFVFSEKSMAQDNVAEAKEKMLRNNTILKGMEPLQKLGETEDTLKESHENKKRSKINRKIIDMMKSGEYLDPLLMHKRRTTWYKHTHNLG